MIEIEEVDEVVRISFYIKGTKCLHREDGPALILEDGSNEWYINGQLHRVDGPAVVDKEVDYEAWYIHGKRHREDGPAQIFSDGKLKWWLNGILFTKERWFEKLSKAQKEKMLYSEYFIGS